MPSSRGGGSPSGNPARYTPLAAGGDDGQHPLVQPAAPLPVATAAGLPQGHLVPQCPLGCAAVKRHALHGGEGPGTARRPAVCGRPSPSRQGRAPCRLGAATGPVSAQRHGPAGSGGGPTRRGAASTRRRPGRRSAGAWFRPPPRRRRGRISPAPARRQPPVPPAASRPRVPVGSAEWRSYRRCNNPFNIVPDPTPRDRLQFVFPASLGVSLVVQYRFGGLRRVRL